MMQTPAPEWLFQNDNVAQVFRTDDGHVLTFMASDLEKQRTGVHGMVKVLVGDRVIAYSRLNIDRNEDRGRLIGRAIKTRAEPQNFLRNGAPLERDGLNFLFDQFCLEAFLKFVSNHGAVDVMGDTLSEIDFLCRPYVMKEAGTILYAPPDSGKTYSGLLLAVSIDAGVSRIFDVPRPRKALFINLERGASGLARRLGFVNYALELDTERPLTMLNARGKTFNDLVEAITQSVDEYGIEVGFLDSISRTGQGGLSDDSAVNRLMDTMNRVLPSWFALAHTPRADSSHIYGSVHFDAAADIMVQSKISRRKDRAMAVRWTVTKANDILRPKPLVIGMQFDDEGLANTWISSVNEFPDLIEGTNKGAPLGARVESYLLEVGKSDATSIAREIGAHRADVSGILNVDKRFQKLGKDGRNVMFGLSTHSNQSIIG